MKQPSLTTAFAFSDDMEFTDMNALRRESTDLHSTLKSKVSVFHFVVQVLEFRNLRTVGAFANWPFIFCLFRN